MFSVHNGNVSQRLAHEEEKLISLKIVCNSCHFLKCFNLGYRQFRLVSVDPECLLYYIGIDTVGNVKTLWELYQMPLATLWASVTTEQNEMGAQTT